MKYLKNIYEFSDMKKSFPSDEELEDYFLILTEIYGYFCRKTDYSINVYLNLALYKIIDLADKNKEHKKILMQLENIKNMLEQKFDVLAFFYIRTRKYSEKSALLRNRVSYLKPNRIGKISEYSGTNNVYRTDLKKGELIITITFKISTK